MTELQHWPAIRNWRVCEKRRSQKKKKKNRKHDTILKVRVFRLFFSLLMAGQWCSLVIWSFYDLLEKGSIWKKKKKRNKRQTTDNNTSEGSLKIFETHAGKYRSISTTWSSRQRPYPTTGPRKVFGQWGTAQTRLTEEKTQWQSYWLTDEQKEWSNPQKTWSLNRNLV